MKLIRMSGKSGKFVFLLTASLGGLLSCGLFYQQAHGAVISGNITFTGRAKLDQPSAGNATMVTAWQGNGTGDRPQVNTADGSFGIIGAGDPVDFHPMWSFNSGSLPSFWSVDGFTFDLTSSTITSQGFGPAGGAVAVDGIGMVSASGFDTSPGSFHFTMLDPSADALFSFSAASSAVPEPPTVMAFVSGASLLGALVYIRCRQRA
jgi:hypothetical protein